MSIDPNISFQSYIRDEITYAKGKPKATDYTPQEVENHAELDHLPDWPEALVNYDPYAVRADKFFGSTTSNTGACFAHHGFYPTPGLVSAKEGKWYNWIGVALKQFATKFKFYLLTHLHPDSKVKSDAKMIQALFKEMHNGAAALTYLKTGKLNPINQINTNVRFNTKDGIEVRIWNSRMNEVCKAILSGQDLSKIALPSTSAETSDFLALMTLQAIHGQSIQFWTDMRSFANMAKGVDVGKYGLILAKTSHRPIIQYSIASQQLYEAVYRAAQNFNAERANDFWEIRNKLAECTKYYKECIDAFEEVKKQALDEAKSVEKFY